MPSPRSLPQALLEQGEFFMRVCNACRYCEGYCAVFPALERRLTFGEGDLAYLANLCHNCGSCYDACQYAPPHEFDLNFPRALAVLRRQTYRKYAWPGFLAGLYERNGLAVGLVLAASLALFILAVTLAAGSSAMFSAHPDARGSFYAVLPHAAMVVPFSLVSLAVLAAFAVGLARFWRDTGERFGALLDLRAWARAAGDVARLTNLDGGGEGCVEPDRPPSGARRRFHHATFYGFLLCFASTTTAAVYHYVFGWHAPYALASLPVVLGTVGGVGLLVGPAGQLWLRSRRSPQMSDPAQGGMDVAFIVLLLLTSATGLLLLALRETAAMGTLLAVHLGGVLALFLTMPYGKFAHAVYRGAALLRFAIEDARPTPRFGAD
jgi:citrate/tricarballylate utilization protein